MMDLNSAFFSSFIQKPIIHYDELCVGKNAGKAGIQFGYWPATVHDHKNESMKLSLSFVFCWCLFFFFFFILIKSICRKNVSQ
jgi:hypothetical protein